MQMVLSSGAPEFAAVTLRPHQASCCTQLLVLHLIAVLWDFKQSEPPQVAQLAAWPTSWLAGCLVVCLVAWLFGCLVVCLVGWLGGWLVGWLVGSPPVWLCLCMPALDQSRPAVLLPVNSYASLLSLCVGRICNWQE